MMCVSSTRPRPSALAGVRCFPARGSGRMRVLRNSSTIRLRGGSAQKPGVDPSDFSIYRSLGIALLRSPAVLRRKQGTFRLTSGQHNDIVVLNDTGLPDRRNFASRSSLGGFNRNSSEVRAKSSSASVASRVFRCDQRVEGRRV